MAYLIGLDIGTTSAKAVLFEESGKYIHAVERDIDTIYRELDWAEQNLVQIEQACKQAIATVIEESKLASDQIIAITFCSAMHSLLAVSQDGEVLTDAIIWSDRRSHHILGELTEKEKQGIYSRTGTPIHPMTPLSKLLWMKRHQAALYASKPYWMSIKEYIVWKWFNIRVIDYSMASATGLLHLESKQWDKKLLDLLELDESQLSNISSPRMQLTALDNTIREELGVVEETLFILGAADGQLASLGIGAIGAGEVAVSVGTSGAIREFTTIPTLSENRATFCYLFDDDYYIVGGPTNNGGVVLQWLKQLIANEMDYDTFLKQADSISIGADGVIFLPYLNGERAPLWDAGAKGNFFGLSIGHSQGHMVRAAIEGITYNLFHILQSNQADRLLDCIYVNGGLSRSKLWLQMMADLFNCKVYVSDTHHGAAWGACWTSLISMQKQNSYEEIKSTINYEQPTYPIQSNHERYIQQYSKYQSVLSAIQPLFN